MNLGQKAAAGFFSILTRNLIARVMGLASMVVLARELDPGDFGLLSITEVLLNVIAVFGVTGVFEFLVSYRGEDREEINQSAFWFNVFVGIGISTLLLLAAPFWAESHGDERIGVLAYFVSGIFLLSCLQILPKSILAQQLDFKTQTRLQNPFIILVPIGKIMCAYAGLGVYSLVAPTLFFGVVQTFLFYKIVRWKFRMTFFAQRWKEIYGFTKHLIGTTLLSRITDDGDKFIVGKFLGLEALGIYSLASQLAQLFPNNVTTVTNQVFAATFPRYAHDKPLMLERYLLVTKTIAFFSLPVLCCMMVAASPLLTLVYSEKWADAILPFQILVLFAMSRSLMSSYGPVLNSLLMPQKAFFPLLVYAPLHVCISLVCGQIGLAQLALGVVFSKWVFAQFQIYQLMSLLQSSMKRFYENLSKIALATALAGFFAAWVSQFSSGGLFLQTLWIGSWFSLAYYLLLQWVGKSDLLQVRMFFQKTNPKAARIFERVFFLH